MEDVGIAYRVNPRLVRGLDYYSRTVFEWITESLGAQGTVCAGGRYDGLMSQLGGKPVPAVGFAMGMERLVELLEASQQTILAPPPHVYVVASDDAAQRAAMALCERMRDAVPGLRLVMNHGGGSFKSQFKKADKSRALWALVLGEDELARDQVQIKPLRGETHRQRTVGQPELAAELNALVECS